MVVRTCRLRHVPHADACAPDADGVLWDLGPYHSLPQGVAAAHRVRHLVAQDGEDGRRRVGQQNGLDEALALHGRARDDERDLEAVQVRKAVLRPLAAMVGHEHEHRVVPHPMNTVSSHIPAFFTPSTMRPMFSSTRTQAFVNFSLPQP